MDQAILERITSLLRRDLKLSPTTPINEGTALFGGEMDLDSIDILLVLTSLEREFGIQLTSDKVSKSAFQSVATLVAFVEQSKRSGTPSAHDAAATHDRWDWLSALPHGPAFRFLSEVTTLEPGRTANGEWNVKGDEWFFAGHFPGRPIVPGVLIAESLGQLAGITAGAGSGRVGGSLAHVDVRFLHAVTPPARMALRVVAKHSLGSLHQFEAVAEVGGICVASGTVTIHLNEAPHVH